MESSELFFFSKLDLVGAILNLYFFVSTASFQVFQSELNLGVTNHFHSWFKFINLEEVLNEKRSEREWEPFQYSGLAAGLTQARGAIHHNDTLAGIDGKTSETLLRGLPNTL